MEESFDPNQLIDWIDEFDREYLFEISCLQIELISLQKHILESSQKLAILFEGRDTAGKGGSILRFRQYLNPRHLRTIALTKPTEAEREQWYFQRYVKHLPDPGQIVFFDRSWYNRAVVEPVMGFCTNQEKEIFYGQVNDFERFLIEGNIKLVKFWFSIESQEQNKRIEDRKTNPLKRWKLSPVDLAAVEKWDDFSACKEEMFKRSSTKISPWVKINGNCKKTARMESIRYILSLYDYPNKGISKVRLEPDSSIVEVF